MNIANKNNDLAIVNSDSKERIDDPIKKALLSFDFNVRAYQFEAVNKSLKALERRRNILISLPPGTGKTIIGQIIAQKWLATNSTDNKVLFLLPNKNLLSQHFRYSAWLHNNNLCSSLSLNGDWKINKKIDHQNSIQKHNLLFALPKFFYNLFNNDYVSIGAIKNIKLVIVDEYDFYSKSIINDSLSDSFDFKKDFTSFSKLPFDEKTRFIFMSATPNFGDGTKENSRTNKKSIWANLFNPKLIQIDKSEYKKYIPVAHVLPIGCANYFAFCADQKITRKISKIYSDIYKYLKSIVFNEEDFSKLITNIDSLLLRKTIKTKKGINVNLVPIHPLITNYKSLKNQRIKLFEDFDDDYEESIEKGSKADVLLQLVKFESTHNNQIIIFIRFIEKCYEIQNILEEVLKIKSVVVHGSGLPDSMRDERISNFKNRNVSVLIATRDLFGRGFDLPEADSAIFYSPKENVRTVWQEFLRIRSTAKIAKNTYVLFYQWTKEAYKMYRLLMSMQAHALEQSDDFNYKYFWEYEEEEKESENNSFFYYDYLQNESFHFAKFYKKDTAKYYNEPIEFSDTINNFAIDLFKVLTSDKFCDKSLKYVSDNIIKMMKKSKIHNHISKTSVNNIISNLSKVFIDDEYIKGQSIRKKRDLLFFRIYPDYCQAEDSIELKFYNDLFGKIYQLFKKSAANNV